jgi:hypothetical protein
VEITNHNELNTGFEQHMHDQFHAFLLEVGANTLFRYTPVRLVTHATRSVPPRIHWNNNAIFSSRMNLEVDCDTRGQPLSRPGEADSSTLSVY